MKIAVAMAGAAATILSTQFFSTTDSSVAAPIALIYQGPGSCDPGTPDGCSESAARVARAAGFKPIFVGPDGTEAVEIWHKAAVWVQPGGRARIQVQTMSAQLKEDIRNFVAGGGGYVGFCAGGFLATQQFGWQNKEDPSKDFEAEALGLMPGYTQYYEYFDEEITEERPATVISTNWLGQNRQVYWELGPYFDKTTVGPGVEVVSRYGDERIMSIRSQFGQGKVFVTAVHPEAPQSWYDYYNLTDSDGTDLELAASMLQWSARQGHP